MDNKYTISILIEDELGVVTRITNLFSRRGFVIEGLTIGSSEFIGVIRMTFVLVGDQSTCEQLTKHLYKIINVIKIQDFTNIPHIERELLLIKIVLTNKNRAEITQIIQALKAKIVDMSNSTLTLEVVGTSDKILAARKLFSIFEVLEVANTGRICLTRNSTSSERKLYFLEEVCEKKKI